MNKRDFEGKQRFGIRKLTIGTCSVLLSTLLWTEVDTQVVHADVANNGTGTPTTEEENSSKTQETEDKKLDETTTNASEILGTKTSQDSNDASSNSEVSSTTSAQENKSVVSESKDTTVKTPDSENKNDTQALDANKQPSSNTKSTTDTDSTSVSSNNEAKSSDSQKVVPENKDQSSAQTSNQQTQAVKDQTQDKTSATKDTQVTDVKDLKSDKTAQKSLALNDLKAESTIDSETNDIKEHAAVKIDSDDGRYTLYVSQKDWGNVPDGNKKVKILLSGNVNSGDEVTISIPKFIGGSLPNVKSQYGSVSQKVVGDYNVVTYDFTSDTTMNPIITIEPGNAYGAKDTPMKVAYPINQPITWTVNGKKQKSTDFNVAVNPNWNPSKVTRIDPDPNGETSLKKMIPDYDVTYRFSVNENDGVQPGEDYTGNVPFSASHINSTVNYGTTITIPMPHGFVLNENETIALNDFQDQTSIKQVGDNIIITVPKGSGKQNWNDGGQGYRIVGQYKIAMPNKATTLKADGSITIVQKLDDNGDHVKTYNSGKGNVVSEEFYGTNDDIPLGTMPLYAKTAYSNGWILNNGKKQIVSYFGLANKSIGSFDNYSGTVNLTFDPRLGVTEIKTPTVSGNDNYKYTITYANGKTAEGQVINGDTIKGTSAISSIAISFDKFNHYESTDSDLPGNTFSEQTQVSKNAFEAYGSVDHSVNEGTELTSSIGFVGHLTEGNLTKTLTVKPQNLTQYVKDPAKLQSSLGEWSWTYKPGAGQEQAGVMAITPQVGVGTSNVYEPVFYYVFPEWTSVYDFNEDPTKMPNFNINGNHGVTAIPKLSEFTVPTATKGLYRQVVKVDYTGTGFNFNATAGTNTWIYYNTSPFAPNGDFHGMIYVVSKKTSLTNPEYGVAKMSEMTPNGVTFDPAWVQNNTDHLYYVGSNTASFHEIGGANTISSAQGNQDNPTVPTNSGTTNLYGSPEMKYTVRLVNDTDDNMTNVETLINLPQASDSNSSFTFQLTEPPTYDGNKSDYTFLYSTHLGNLLSNNSATGAKPDDTGYVTADKVTKWEDIKSIIVKTDKLAKNERSESLIITGTDPNLVKDAGKTGYISTGFYSDSTKPFISSKANSKVAPGHITITGTATINYSLHYKDTNGQDHNVIIPGMSTSYDLSKNNTMISEKAASDAEKNENVKAELPDGYEFTNSVKLIPGAKSWQTDDKGGIPAFGGQVQYFYNGATIQLEAAPIIKKLTYQVIDQNDPADPSVIQNPTDLLDNENKPFTGLKGSSVPTGASAAYTNVQKKLQDEGYVISDSSSKLPTKFSADDTPLTIYVTHKMTQVSHDDPITIGQKTISGKTIDGAHENDLNQTITRTINVTNPDNQTSTTTQVAKIYRDASYDEVTGKVTYKNWSTDTTDWAKFDTPTIVGYTPTQSSVSAVTVKDGQKDETVNISYRANMQFVTIDFVDNDDPAHNIVKYLMKSGVTDETINNFSDVTIPENYELAQGQELPTSYKFTASANQVITINLVHQKVTVDGSKPDTIPSGVDKNDLIKDVVRTINYTGLSNDQLDQIPVNEKTQTVEFTRTAQYDKVTKKLIANSETAWIAKNGDKFVGFTVPTFAGYTPNTEKIGEVVANVNYPVITAEVAYQADPQDVTIEFVDDDKAGTPVVGTPIVKTGKTNEKLDGMIFYPVPDNYDLVDNQAGVAVSSSGQLTVTYTYTAEPDQVFKIHLKHQTERLDGSTTTDFPSKEIKDQLVHQVIRRINKVWLDHKVDAVDQTATITRSAIYDKVTKQLIDGTESAWTTDTTSWKAIDVPTAPDGYSLDRIEQIVGLDGTPTHISKIDNEAVTNETKPTEIDVFYKADPQKVKINFVDDDNNGSIVETEDTNEVKEGTTDEKTEVPLVVPDNYDLSSTQNLSDQAKLSSNGRNLTVSYKYTAAKNQVITIHLVHQTEIVDGSKPNEYPSDLSQADKDKLTKNITRTIEYSGLNNEQLSEIPAEEKGTQTVEFTRTAKYDKVTKKLIDGSETTWTVNGSDKFAGFTVPTFAGYTADKTKVAEVTVKSSDPNSTVTIAYTADDQSVTIRFIDDDHKNSAGNSEPIQVGQDITESGKTDTAGAFSLDMPANYDLKSDQHGISLQNGKVLVNYTFTADKDQVVEIHLAHQTEIVNGNDPTNIPSDVNHDALIKNVTRTIHEYLPSGEVDQNQTATITRSATYDKVTKQLSNFSDWTKDESSWSAVTVPTVDGYTFVITQEGETTPLESIKGQIVDENTKPVVINVNYTATATAELTGNGSTTYTGQPITIDNLNDQNNGLKIRVTGPTANDGQLDLKTGDVEFSTDGIRWTTSLPTDAKTYQVRLTTQGKNVIIDKYGNANIIWTDKSGNSTITSNATFTIDPVNENSVLNNLSVGNYTKVYDGVATTSVDPSKFGTTVQLNGQTVNLDMTGLTSADFQWTDAQGNALTNAPKNVGTYYIKLTSSGLTILQDNNKNFTLTNSGLGTYTITQAQASGKLDGTNSRTYNGQATTTAEVNSNGQIVVTVNFPGVTNNKYILKNGDYAWSTSDGNAPTNAGDYTITLTPTGINGVENYIVDQVGRGQNNTPNVTFKNSDFTGSAKYTINKADATAKLDGSFDRTYNGSADNTAISHTVWSARDTSNKSNFDLTHNLDYVWYTKDANGKYVEFNGAPVNAGTYYLVLTNAYIDKLNQENPNYNFTKAEGTFTYTIDKATATATISGSQNDKYNGHSVTINYDNFPVTITTNNGQAITAPSGAKLTANDIVITDSKCNLVTAPTKIDTYTIKLTKSGLQKFESQTDNYDWISAGTGILSITRNTDTSVKLEGNENVVYTGNTAAITPSSFHVILGNGETYTLQKGDLQYIDQTAGANTNVGTYQVELSDQGRNNIANIDADNYGYDFTKVGNGTVTVTKATPSATITGTVEKSYDGTPISGYIPTVTITAPGNNSVTLTAGEFEWTKDGQTYTTAPSDAGTYTVVLTDTGIAKIKTVNSQNLDWSNVQITGNGTYKIDKANATIIMPNERTETAIWNGHAVAINPSDFVPSITSDNPNAKTIALPSTLNLTAGDYQFVQNGQVISAPSEVGTYQVQLTEKGWHKVRDAVSGHANYNWTYQGNGTYNIDKASATIKLNGSSSTIYSGNSAIIPSKNGTVTGITVTLSNGQTYRLKPEDLEFVDDHGQKINAPTNAGTYKVRLSNTGIGNISGLENNHYNYTYNNGTVDFTINKANADVTISQTETRSYTGGAISPDASDFAIAITTNNGQTLTYGLRSGDVATTVKDPTNVGSYDVVLTDSGKTRIQELNSNYNYNFVNSHGTLQITQARATATLSGQGTRVYNGSAVTIDDLNVQNATNNITLTLHYPKDGNADYSTTVKLTANDFVWNTPDGSAPVDANSRAYTLSLKPSVIKALLEQAAGSGQDNMSNVSVSDSDITGTASYIITPLESTATVSNIETGNYGKTYDAQVTDQIDPAKLHIITIVNGKTVELDMNGLTGSAFEWVDENGTPLTADDYPKNVGTYHIALTATGLSQLQTNNPNFTLTSAGQGNYVISQAQGRAELVGNNSKIYNGSAISTAEINSNGQIVVNLTFPGAETDASYTLQNGDYTITPNDPSDTNLADVGTYTIALTNSGKKNIAKKVEELSGSGQDNQANVIVSDSAITGDAQFTIDAANNVVDVSGTQTETYTGQPINVVYNPDGNNSVTINIASTAGSVANIDSVQLDSSDFHIVDTNDNPIIATNAGGIYHIVLTQTGINKIQNKLGKNYKITQNSTSFGNLIINKATASAIFSGNPTYTYTGTPTSDYLKGFTVTLSEPGNPTYALQNGDIEFNVDGTWTKSVPINKGTYDVRLSENGWNHIKDINKDNVSWPDDANAGTGTYTINAATATTELSGQNSMVYSGNPVTTANLYSDGSTIKVEISGNHIAGLPSSFTLKDGNYTWNTGTAPKDVGHYTITLNEAGLDKIQAAIDQAVGKGNVVLSRNNTGSAEFRITQAVSANIQLDGSLQKQYDGNAASFDPTNVETKANYHFNNAIGLTIPNLTAADFEWVDESGKAIAAPTDVGYYYLQLNKKGKDAIADANPNYTFVNKDGQSVINGRITYDIYAATLQVGVSGTAWKVYNGQDATVSENQIGSKNGINLVWGNSNAEPVGLGKFTLTSGDLEVVDAAGNPVSHANIHDNSATGNPVYYVRLTNDALNKIRALTGAKNYDISLLNDQNKYFSQGNYLIYAHKAQVTLTGNQTTPYGTDLALDPTKYAIALTNWTKDAPVPTNAEILQAIGGLKARDVYIDGYATSDKMPTNVGSYKVMISSQLLTKLKQVFPDYDWDAEIEVEHDPARYVITPAVTTVTINGAQHIKYGEDNTIKYGDGGYTMTITAPVKNATTDNVAQPIYTTVKLTSGDLQFVLTPKNVGTYEVKLSAQGLKKLKDLTGSTNYDWAQASKARANFFVDQMPVTITVGGATQTVTYGSTEWLKAIKEEPQGYTLTIKTADGTPLTYKAKTGDLVFNQVPGNVGDYEVKLSTQGLTNIKAALGTNYGYPQVADDVTSHGTFKVSQGDAIVTLNGNDSKTYDGKITEPKDLNINNYKLNYSVTVYAPNGTAQIIELAPSDLQFVGGNPVNKGHYQVELSQSGKDKLTALTGNNGDNYKWMFDTKATYDINVATEASVELKGSNQKIFDGKAVTTEQINNGGNILVHFTFPDSNENSTYQLQDGDYTWANGSAPTNVGTYTINLTQAGLTHLQNAIDALAGKGNVVLSADKLNGSATFEIIPKLITNVIISGDDQNKTYDGKVADLNVGGLTMSGDGTIGNTPLSDNCITANDFVWNTADGKAPTNAGHYEARLKVSVLKTLQDANKNYSFDVVNGTIKYTINPKIATETMGNSGSKTYDSNGVSVSDVLNSITWNSTGLVNGEQLNLSNLAANDYEWYTKNADGTYTAMTGEPTDAGTYYLKLKAGSIDKIKDANPNYSFADGAISGEFTYTIKKANADIVLPNTSSQTITWTGNPATIDPKKFVPIITSDNPNAKTITLPSTLNLTAGDYQFLLNGHVIDAPSEVGTYQVQLTDTGWHKVRDAISGNNNYNWNYSGEGNYYINKAAATITLNGSSSTVYSGNPVVIPSQNGTVTGITVTLSNGQTYDLKSNDLEFVNDQGNKIETPIDAGHYKVRLTAPAVAAISKLVSDHYNYTYDNGTVDFDVTQTPVTISVGNKTNVPSVIYGKPINLDPSDYSITVKTDDGKTLNYIPVAGDLQFKNGTPTATGTYEVVLSNTGLQNIKNKFGTKNYTYSLTGQGSFDVKTATAEIKINGSDSKLYDGNSATLTPSDYNLEVTTNNGQTINIPITAGDLVFGDGSAPVNVGTYDVTLSQGALDKIKQEYTNYNWSNPIAGKYIINKAAATVTTGNSYDVTYNGQTPEINVGKITNEITTNNGVNIPVPTLESDDYEWVDADGNPVAAPVNVGTYYLKLKDSSHSKIADNNNYDWKFNGLASVTITPVNAVISFGGIDSETYTGNLIAPNSDKFTITLPNGVTHVLTADDIQVIGDPVNVGNYKVELKKSAVDAINAANENYNLTYDGSQSTLSIVPADTTAVIEGSQTTKTPVIDPGKFTVTVNGHTISGLTADDLIFSQNGHPVDLTQADTYDVELSGDAINKIRQGNPNYNITFNSSAKFVLENSNQTVEYIDSDNNVIKSDTVGNDIEGTKVPFTPNVPAGWKLSDPKSVPSEITLVNGTTTIKIEHATITVTPDTDPKDVPTGPVPGNPSKNYEKMDNITASPTRTIIVNKPDGTTETIIQVVDFTRTATFDEVTGEVTYSEWKFKSSSAKDGKADWETYIPETISGYTVNPNEVASENVTPTTGNTTVTITYIRNNNGNVTTPPDINPSQPTEPTQPTEQPSIPEQPSTPIEPTEPQSPSEPSGAPVKPTKEDKDDEKQNSTSKDTESNNAPKGTSFNRHAHNYLENGPINSQKNTGLNAENNSVRPLPDSKAIGPKGTIFYKNANVIRGNKENAKDELPQTGSAHEGPLAWLGSLFAGLSLFGLAVDRKRKKKDDK